MRAVLRAIACMLLASAPAEAGSIFDGDWIADLDTQSGLPTDIYLVRDGQYACQSCSPPRAYPADGILRPVPGDPDQTSEAVRITGPRQIITHIVGSALDRTTTMTVAPDDRTATYVSIDRRPGISAALRTSFLARRLAAAPPGAHAVSGTWQGVRDLSVPAELRTVTLHLDGDTLHYSTPLGTAFSTKLGGDFVPVRSAHAADVQAAVRQIGDRQIEERVMVAGKVVLIRIFTVSRDGRSMETASTDLATGTVFRATSRRQR